MKNILGILSFVVLFAACKKDDDEGNSTPPPTPAEEYINKMEGLWTLEDVNYSFTLPPFQQGLPPIPINGSGSDVVGTFKIDQNPDEVDYKMSFGVGIPSPIGGDTISLPVFLENKGTYTVNDDATEITVNNNDGSVSNFEILLDRDNKQILRTLTPYAVPQFDTVDVTAELTLER